MSECIRAAATLKETNSTALPVLPWRSASPVEEKILRFIGPQPTLTWLAIIRGPALFPATLVPDAKQMHERFWHLTVRGDDERTPICGTKLFRLEWAGVYRRSGRREMTHAQETRQRSGRDDDGRRLGFRANGTRERSQVKLHPFSGTRFIFLRRKKIYCPTIWPGWQKVTSLLQLDWLKKGKSSSLIFC